MYSAFKIGLSVVLILCFYVDGFSQQVLNVTKLKQEINIDGFLESTWLCADSSFVFIQIEPLSGSASTRKTIVRSVQTDKSIYFSFKCYIDKADELAARIQRRDQLDYSDDVVSVILDTYNDNRTALLFQVNALGTITDAKINDDGRNIDYLWDTEWEASTSVVDSFWVAEIKIPFNSIQYKPEAAIWGCNFSRSIRANNEVAWWSPVNQNNRVSQNGALRNIRIGSEQKHSLSIFPYTTLRYSNSNISGIKNGFEAQVGGDVEYKYSSNLKANLTVKPDFATVEGDKEQVNLTPWELKFPEKRLFFQDGNDMFKTRIQTFYSRRIGDIQVGGKMTGKIDKFQFNGLYAKTKGDNSLQLPEARFNAFRVKKDVLNSSTLGFIYADKVTDTATYRSFNLDYVLNFGKTWKLTGQYVASLPGDLKSHSAWFVRFARENNIYHYHIRFTSLGENFRDNVNQTGFIPDDDRLEVDSDIEYKFWFNKRIKYLFLSGKNNIFWNQHGTLRSWTFTYGSRIYFNNKFSFDAYYRDEFQLLDKKYYNNHFHFIGGYNSDEASRVTIAYRFGKNYDRDFKLFEFNSRFKILKKLSVSYELNKLSFSPDPAHESTWLNLLGLDYYLTNDLWLRVFAQNNSKNDKYYFYGLFGWRFKPPFGALYLIVNTDNYYNSNRNANLFSEIFFLKLTYPISIVKR